MIVQITCAKVGHRQAPFKQEAQPQGWAFCSGEGLERDKSVQLACLLGLGAAYPISRR